MPYAVFTDDDVYRLENERIFRGPVWNYLCHEIELPNGGDFVTTWVGETHVIAARNNDGVVHAFENSCAHRGAKITSAVRGNAKRLTCPYHLWTYTLAGDLQAVTFERGVGGKGGMPAGFEKQDHGLNKLRVAIYGGLVFGTFSDATPPLEEFLGPYSMSQIDRLLVQRRPRVLGYLRQRIPGNWKLYNENVRDPYHGSLLHQFQVSFGLQTPTMRGGIKMDRDLKNTWNHSILTEQDAGNRKLVAEAYAGTGKFNPDLKMADPALTRVPLDLGDNYKTTILSILPALIVAQVDNTYAIRHLRPKGPDLVELHITYLGFESDTLIGGVGPIVDTDYLSQEISIRGFWSFHQQIMGLPATGHAENKR